MKVPVDDEIRAGIIQLLDNANALLATLRAVTESKPVADFLRYRLPLIVEGGMLPEAGIYDAKALAGLMGFDSADSARKWATERKVPTYRFGKRHAHDARDMIQSAKQIGKEKNGKAVRSCSKP
jgi:hypothetical protein